MIGFVLSLIELPFKNKIGIADFVGLILCGFSLIPYYGYAYQVAIGNQVIAIIIFFINLLLTGFASYPGVVYTVHNISFLQLVFVFLGIALTAIIFYPQFMYAFKSKNIWSRDA